VVLRPTGPQGQALLDEMVQVGSPIGEPYIHPILIERETMQEAQVVRVEDRAGTPTAVQRFGLIDSNLVKNFRNRLTAAALGLWNEQLGERAVTIEQHPWLPRDVPYTAYFGLALLPTAVFVAAGLLGGALMAQDFEFDTITEYRLAPTPMPLVLGARLARLALTALLGAGLLLPAVGLVTGVWPDSPWAVVIVLLPTALIAASLGTIAGLLLRRTIPSFVVGLTLSFGGWILGSGFGLAAGFGGLYERVSRLVPNTHVVELLFPSFYGVQVGQPWHSALFLAAVCLGVVALTGLIYYRRVLGQE